MNILLTGGAGYIGSHTALALKQAGFVPVVLDSLVNGHDWAVKYGPFVQGDVGDEDAVRKLCAEYKPAAVVHFAAFIEVAESVANPAKYMGNNYHKAARLFDTLSDCGVKKIVFSSTAAVYGTPESDASIPETHPLRPINPYGESKLAAETYLRALESQGVQSVALRYFNAAGAAPAGEKIGEAHNPETHLIPNVIRAGLDPKEPMKLFGTDYPTPDGTAVRDYIHVMDLAAAHIAALLYLLDGKGTDICNLGTGRGSSVKEVIGAVERALGKTIPVKHEQRRAGDPPRLVADASRAREKLGWEPQKTLDQIVESALAWHKSETFRRAVTSN
ncbi:MAG: UDP-glucose 4-epimerase GalE [Alphaproteobacteria bacterium]|nr:UDP-glucose 4-epimerase GalE [Alphaproteobacteria bacterium]